MLIAKHTVETTSTPEQIWKVWEDAECWGNWDREIELTQLDGPFRAGTMGRLKLKGGPLMKTLLTCVEPLKMFVQEAKLFLATAIMTHSMTRVAGKTQVTFQTEIRGPLTLFYGCLIGGSIREKDSCRDGRDAQNSKKSWMMGRN